MFARRHLSVALKAEAFDDGGMGRDRSLAEFTAQSDATDEEFDEETAENEFDEDGAASDEAATGDSIATPASGIERSTGTDRTSVTARVVPSGGACDDCAAVTEQLWVSDDTALCVDCFGW